MLSARIPTYTRLGGSQFRFQGNGAVQTIVAAATNVRGLVLRTGLMIGSNAYAALGFGPNSGSVTDIVAAAPSTPGAGNYGIQLLPYPLLIPAGQGLFTNACPAGSFVIGSYDLL